MEKLSKVVGIISYLPDDVNKREHRLVKLTQLIKDCNRLFDLPIIIIAQNWPDDLFKDEKNLIIHRYEKPLTIVGARKELRRVFLEEYNYDYLIMLDDDCEIVGNDATRYLKQIDDNPDCWILTVWSELKLFAISRTIFAKTTYDDVREEYKEGWEDWVFLAKLTIFLPTQKRWFKDTGLRDLSKTAADPYSTWYKNDITMCELYSKTLDHIKKYDKNFTFDLIAK